MEDKAKVIDVNGREEIGPSNKMAAGEPCWGGKVDRKKAGKSWGNRRGTHGNLQGQATSEEHLLPSLRLRYLKVVTLSPGNFL